ncbi:MAG: cyclic nucleotide-binding domain-containing protein [Planctomycetota bacterium]
MGIIYGFYEVLEELPSWTSGIVYRARHRNSGELAAIKIMDLSGVPEEDRRIFYDTAARVKTLNHRNIARVADVCRRIDTSLFDPAEAARENAYIVQEFVQGKALDKLIKVQGPFMPQLGIYIIQQVVDALAYGHGLGLPHRNLTLANIMLMRNGKVKLVDYGIGRLFSSGTIFYMSPEDIGGQAVTERAEIFSTGSIMFEILLGGRAFHGESFGDLMNAIMAGASDQVLMDKLPDSVRPIIGRCLKADPNERYGSFKELQEEIVRLQQSGKLFGFSVPFGPRPAVPPPAEPAPVAAAAKPAVPAAVEPPPAPEPAPVPAEPPPAGTGKKGRKRKKTAEVPISVPVDPAEAPTGISMTAPPVTVPEPVPVSEPVFEPMPAAEALPTHEPEWVSEPEPMPEPEPVPEPAPGPVEAVAEVPADDIAASPPMDGALTSDADVMADAFFGAVADEQAAAPEAVVPAAEDPATGPTHVTAPVPVQPAADEGDLGDLGGIIADDLQAMERERFPRTERIANPRTAVPVAAPVPPAAARPAPAEQSAPAAAPTGGERKFDDPFLQMIADVPMFAELDADQVRKFGSVIRTRSFTDGSEIIRKGQPGEYLFVILDGRVAVVQEDSDGNEIELTQLGEGDCFGEMSLLTGDPCSATIRAKGPSTLLALFKDDFQSMLNEYPRINAHFNKILIKRLRKTNLKFENEIEKGMTGRLDMISITELIQTIHLGQKTGRLQLTRGRHEGFIAFDTGAIVAADLDRHSGERAFYLLLEWNDGTFRFAQDAPGAAVHNLDVDTNGLLIECARRLDETRKLLKYMQSASRVFAIQPDILAQLDGIEVSESARAVARLFNGRRSITDVIEANDDHKLETLESIIELYTKDILEEVQPTRA